MTFEPASAGLVAALQHRLTVLEAEVRQLKARPERLEAEEVRAARRAARTLATGGWTYREIAGVLKCTERTVQRYMKAINK